MLYAIIHTEGVMNFQELRTECSQKNWLPVMVARHRENPDSPPIVLTFTSPQVCERFCKRNLPKDWVSGWVNIDEPIIQWMRDQGWRVQVFKYPHKMHNLPHVEFGVEVVHFPQLTFQHGRF